MMIYILYYFLPFILLYVCFPWYASVHKAMKAGKLSLWDLGIQAVPFLVVGILDIYCNISASFLFREWPFLRYNWTLSQRCCYWWNHPEDKWRHGLAHATKVQTDKYEPEHIH